MRGLVAAIMATALLVVSTSGVVADPAGPGPAFTGRLAFGPFEPDQPSVTGCGEPQVIEPFSDRRLEGDVAITGWWGGCEPS